MKESTTHPSEWCLCSSFHYSSVKLQIAHYTMLYAVAKQHENYITNLQFKRFVMSTLRGSLPWTQNRARILINEMSTTSRTSLLNLFYSFHSLQSSCFFTLDFNPHSIFILTYFKHGLHLCSRLAFLVWNLPPNFFLFNREHFLIVINVSASQPGFKEVPQLFHFFLSMVKAPDNGILNDLLVYNMVAITFSM